MYYHPHIALALAEARMADMHAGAPRRTSAHRRHRGRRAWAVLLASIAGRTPARAARDLSAAPHRLDV
jgi:hypothetical protein